MSLSVGVVITNHDTWPLAIRCAESVLTHDPHVDDIVVLDDASHEGPPAGVSSRVRIERNATCLGLVRTLNRAVAMLSTDIIVVFDSDAYPLEPFTQIVRTAFSAEESLGILGFRTFDEKGFPTSSAESEPNVASLLLGQRLHLLARRIGVKGRSRPLCVYTCAMAMRRSMFDAIGGFDEQFDWLDLDHDLCMSAWRQGWRVAQADELRAYHVGGGTPQATSARVVRFYRNRWLLLRKHGKIRWPRAVRWAVATRLAAEYVALRAGALAWQGTQACAEDKLKSRIESLRVCFTEYR